ncbi:MAG: acetyl-CoA C-acetyltransferase [Gemmatimonadetes bacterium]|nr:acetyl-CoA C-acetyltransferase [Gemmatimonadota bacterium]
MPSPATTAVILRGGARTPIGRFLGGLSSFSAPQLGAIAIRAAVDRAGIDAAEVDEVIMGHVLTAGAGQAPARQAAVHSGLSPTIPALTVNKVCGSGLKAVMLAAQAIRAGDARLIVAGGMESMSNAPHYLRGLREGVKFGDQTVQDGLIHDGLWCSFGSCHMGGHAEYTASKAGVSRADADAFSLRSHEKAVAATREGRFRNEIVPVEVPSRGGPKVVDTDEGPRADTSLEALSRLKPAFVRDAPADVREHVVTAGNAPGLNDGGAAVVVASLEYAKAHGLEVDAVVTAYSSAATEPRDLFFAPIEAVKRLMGKEGKSIGDYALFEVNEAFAVQAIADMRGLGMDADRVNVNGGAVALGHPIGASGTRILVTLLHAMNQRGASSGMATLCLGGGSAVALSVEKP